MKAKYKEQVITNRKSLEALTKHMNEMVLEWEEQIVAIRNGVVRYERLITDIRVSGKYVQQIESNIK